MYGIGSDNSCCRARFRFGWPGTKERKYDGAHNIIITRQREKTQREKTHTEREREREREREMAHTDPSRLQLKIILIFILAFNRV